jgi:hypothetical protein
MKLVSTELQGSNKGYDQRMLDALTQAESALNSSMAALRQASDALDRAQMI